MAYEITVGYATFNRINNIIKRVSEVINIGEMPGVEFIFIDNCSSDGTFEFLEKKTAGTNIVCYQNSENLGFAGNFVEVVRKARGKYVIWFSDEDTINVEGLRYVLDFIKKKEFGFLVSNYNIHMKDGKIREYRKNKRKEIMPRQLWSCSHLPGVVFNQKYASVFFDDFSVYKNEYPSLSRYYPHVLLFIAMFSKSQNYFFDKTVASQVDHSHPQHQKVNGSQYYHLSQRWEQHKEIIAFSNFEKERAVNKLEIFKLDSIINEQYNRLYSSIKKAVSMEDKKSAESLDKGCRKQLFFYKVSSRIIYFMKSRLLHVFK